jgi:hypothetical protein
MYVGELLSTILLLADAEEMCGQMTMGYKGFETSGQMMTVG